MSDICWFCNENESNEDKVYKVELVMQGNRKDTKIVDVKRCDRCEELHKKGHRLSTMMYIAEIALIAVLLFVFKLDFIYVAIIYLVLMRVFTTLSQKIRRKTAEPYKAVCDVYQNEEVAELVEQGYMERRRF